MRKWHGLMMIGLFLPCVALAEFQGNLGDLAHDATDSLTVVSDFVGTVALVLGILALVSSFLRYLQHRVNPLAVPLGGVFLLGVLGCFLIALPFSYLLFGAGIPFRPPHL